MLKVIGFNGSPRKGWNTDLLLNSFLDGAKSKGAQTKLYHLNDMSFKGCQSCMVCKKGDDFAGKCHFKDDISPILKEIKEADAIVIGSPIYFSLPSSLALSFIERICFSNATYGNGSAFGKKINTAMLYSMNYPKEMALKEKYDETFKKIEMLMSSVFGNCESLSAFDTMQVKDYSKYDIKWFDGNKKQESRKTQFPLDLQKAFEMGQKICIK